MLRCPYALCIFLVAFVCLAVDTKVITRCQQGGEGDSQLTGACERRLSRSPRRPTPEFYEAQRTLFFRYEESKALGAEVELSEQELQANQKIMEVKMKEYEEGIATPHLFKPSQHFFSVIESINESPLFDYLRRMPKGGVLHAHDTAMCSTDYVIELTYRENLWVCQKAGDLGAVALRFAQTQPNITTEESCEWELLSKVREVRGAQVVDDYLRERFSLYPAEKFLDNNEAWTQFMRIFFLLDGVLLYAPVWADYYYNALEEFQEDGVLYLEFRSTLPILYDMEGNDYTEMDTVRIYKETLDKYMADHSDFIGSKVIYAPIRNTNVETVENYIRICTEIKEKYPDFLAGFDLVGQEELGRPLKEFVPQLLTMPDNIDFYFHAGETNWNGADVDENLIDAILLDTKRIGHGFALVKHPMALQLIKERSIPVEINPISNQVLQLVSDYRNHPCAHYFADNYTVVISSDDPSFWRAKPLSHDFYIAFLGIASTHADLRLLKKLALNSLEYSALGESEKEEALAKWQKQWDAFIDDVIQRDGNAAIQRLATNRID